MRNPQPLAHPALRRSPAARCGVDVLTRIGGDGLARLRHLDSTTCPVLAAAGFAFLFLATRHHARAQPTSRMQKLGTDRSLAATPPTNDPHSA